MQPSTPASHTRDLPSDCALAIALPLTSAEFHRDVDAANKDFARSWREQFDGFSPDYTWREYERYANLVTDVSRAAEEAGVTVKPQAAITDWVSLLPRFRVVSLTAHCTGPNPGDSVEFADGLYRPEEIVAAMPPNYAGTVDLTVCFSLHLAPFIKRSFPHCTAIANKRQAQLDHRMALYRQTIRLLGTGSYSFIDAMKEVQLAVLTKAKVAAQR